jgi:histidine triad (HIT) family protein
VGVDAQQRQLVTAPDCAFCAIVAGSVVAESAHSLAFCDLREPHAATEGAHVLMVPRAHAQTLDRLDEGAAADLLQLAVRVSRLLVAEYGDGGFSLWQSNGEAAFQEVPQVHLHLLTRRTDDALLRIYPGVVPAPTAPQQLDALAARLRRHAEVVRTT